ncbi:MAG: SIS domain-containing protein [Porticoccaceae bacterium]|nr:SIS domain-containing protein [Porticoccaceae bacterium]MDG1475447.1 SIS domain-containing protein [Porticoccaceae bacterium]
MEKKIFQQFQQMIETTMVVGDIFTDSIVSASKALSDSLLEGGTILTCGDQSGMLVANLFCRYLTHGIDIDRPGFPALNLNAQSEGLAQEDRYSSLLSIHGNKIDTLFVVSGGGNSPALIKLLNSAIEKGMSIVLLSSGTDEALVECLGYTDTLINLSDFSPQMATLAQVQIAQCMCTLIDNKILGEM